MTLLPLDRLRRPPPEVGDRSDTVAVASREPARDHVLPVFVRRAATLNPLLLRWGGVAGSRQPTRFGDWKDSEMIPGGLPVSGRTPVHVFLDPRVDTCVRPLSIVVPNDASLAGLADQQVLDARRNRRSALEGCHRRRDAPSAPAVAGPQNAESAVDGSLIANSSRWSKNADAVVKGTRLGIDETAFEVFPHQRSGRSGGITFADGEHHALFRSNASTSGTPGRRHRWRYVAPVTASVDRTHDRLRHRDRRDAAHRPHHRPTNHTQDRPDVFVVAVGEPPGRCADRAMRRG